jgi:hypothetical protein
MDKEMYYVCFEVIFSSYYFGRKVFVSRKKIDMEESVMGCIII